MRGYVDETGSDQAEPAQMLRVVELTLRRCASAAWKRGPGLADRRRQLPKGLAGIRDVAAANRWLKEVWLHDYNRWFAIAPEQEGSAFVADRAQAWREILCVVEDRVVGNDSTIVWGGRRLQLPESRLRPHFLKRGCARTNIVTRVCLSVRPALTPPRTG